MLKLMLVAIFLGTWIPCYPKEPLLSVKELNLHGESLALVYICCGNANLLEHNCSSALEDFERASSLLSNLEERMLEMEFFVAFGRAIAYDNLGWKDQCQNAIGSIFLILNEGQFENGGDSDPNALDELLPQEYEEATNIMNQLASLAKTPRVHAILRSIVEEMSEELLPLFKIADAAPLGMLDWGYDCRNGDISVDRTSWFKKAEKFSRKAYKVILKVKKVWDLIKDIDEALRNT